MQSTRSTTRIGIAIGLLILLPLLLHVQALLGIVRMDPLPFYGQVGDNIAHHRGAPWIDPNVGFQGQALGKLSADLWLSGQVPWWNPYSGVGLPLAAEAQPGSLFLPFVLLYHFRDGGIWVALLLQIISGLSTYALLRKIKLGALAALTGGLLFELNGTFAWLGAPIISPIAFLPALLLCVEHLHGRMGEHRRGGWLWIPITLAMSLYAGFPEVAYINGLLVGLWVLVRLPELEARYRLRYICTLAGAVMLGIALSLPLLVPFMEMLTLSDIGSHNGAFAHTKLPLASLAHSLMPWLYGPIFAFNDPGNHIMVDWANTGGYIPAVQVGFALLGLLLAPRKLTFALAVWMLLCLVKTFDVRPISDALNLIPLIKSAAFYRYAPPSWEFAGAVLAAFAVNALATRVSFNRLRAVALFALVLILTLCTIYLARDPIGYLLRTPHVGVKTRIALEWMLLSITLGAILVVLTKRWHKANVRLIAILLVFDAGIAFAMPLGSGTRPEKPDMSGIAFLQSHIGLQRVYSMGPLAPNYGGYFKIAQINHNYLPVTRAWMDYIHQYLDPKAFETAFLGTPTDPTRNQDAFDDLLRKNLASYENLGVRYVLTGPGWDPFSSDVAIAHDNTQLVIRDLAAGEDMVIHWQWALSTHGNAVKEIAVLVGNYWDHSDGYLEAQVCTADGNCSTGRRALSESTNNGLFSIPLDQPLAIHQDASSVALTIRLRQSQSTVPVNVYLSPTPPSSDAQTISVEGAPASMAPVLSVRVAQMAGASTRHVYSGTDMEIYELADANPYFETTDARCSAHALSRTAVETDCPFALHLTRREAFYPGWYASIDGVKTAIEPVNSLFQSVPIPAGAHHIAFRYRPTWFAPTISIFSVTLLIWLLAAWREWRIWQIET